MKKKSTEISVNTSSGAEKVERIEREQTEGKSKVKKTTTSKKTATGEAAMGNPSAEEMKRVNANLSDGKAERESAQAKARVDMALKRKEAQAARKEARKARAEKKAEERKKKLAEKKARVEKRAAEKKAKAEKRLAEKKALVEKRKAEKESKLRERAHQKANRHNENYKKKKAKSQRRERRSHREDRNKGYGGWIAAVVSLGVVTLALGTTVTVGAIEMSKENRSAMGAHRATMYELTGLMENVDGDLDRVRISNSPAQQSRILTDLLVQTRLAELDLEKLPFTAETDGNVTAFINRTAKECERMLGKLRRGGALSEKDKECLEELYQKNHTVRTELDNMVANMSDKDVMQYIKKGEGMLKEGLDKIEKSTITENALGAGNMKMEGAGKQSPPSAEEEKGDKPHIEAATAESLCTEYFSGYNVADFQCIGETVSRGYEAYNVQGYDDRGNQLFAEVSQADGTLLRFDYYEECAGEKFDLQNAERIAEEFLEKLGYDDIEVVRFRANGSTTDFTFVYEDDDVAYYPDEIRVKVCRTRGVVSGFDCTKYVRNHKARKEAQVKLTLAEAYGKLYEGLTVEASRLAVVKTMRGERTAYEFLCSYGEERYFVYLDAENGEEISIVNAKAVS